MIFIVARFTVRPEYSDEWLEHVRSFTESTRQEPGNLWFEWSRDLEDPNQFVLLEHSVMRRPAPSMSNPTISSGRYEIHPNYWCVHRTS